LEVLNDKLISDWIRAAHQLVLIYCPENPDIAVRYLRTRIRVTSLLESTYNTYIELLQAVRGLIQGSPEDQKRDFYAKTFSFESPDKLYSMLRSEQTIIPDLTDRDLQSAYVKAMRKYVGHKDTISLHEAYTSGRYPDFAALHKWWRGIYNEVPEYAQQLRARTGTGSSVNTVIGEASEPAASQGANVSAPVAEVAYVHPPGLSANQFKDMLRKIDSTNASMKQMMKNHHAFVTAGSYVEATVPAIGPEEGGDANSSMPAHYAKLKQLQQKNFNHYKNQGGQAKKAAGIPPQGAVPKVSVPTPKMPFKPPQGHKGKNPYNQAKSGK
jgi:hypothetical protein